MVRADSPRFTAALGRRRGPVDRGVGGLGVRGSGGRRGPPRQAGAYSQRGHRQDDAPPHEHGRLVHSGEG
uniref:Uncharacterized protein n=1 Tax=Oryza glumipatula TaxID=40148 RepID=A0A0D9YVC0_9ORYZ